MRLAFRGNEHARARSNPRYMAAVIVGSLRDLGGDLRYGALLIGVMSISSVWVAFFLIQRSMAKGAGGVGNGKTVVPTNTTEEKKTLD